LALAKTSEKYQYVGQLFFYVIEFFCGEIAWLRGIFPKEGCKQSSLINRDLRIGSGIVELRLEAIVPE